MLLFKKNMRLLTYTVFQVCLFASNVYADPKSWSESYIEAGDLVKKHDLSSAAFAYYRAQLASSWAKELRPSAFVGNGNDPGTFRSAINQVLGESINPWTFQDPKKRLLPILDKLEQEVEALHTSQELSNSIYSGSMESEQKEEEAKYPYAFPIEERLAKFKAFAAKWIAQGRAAAGR